ncbi:putative membrane protein YczE [Evansella vedderi]|uniref:Membrane protein YczE n=1 Tax=Evansella vedderi TaxID=38282 RepID=A0ABT9ZZK0_9BACI|nr:membrane protein [Evansella vedderi]MDQ0256663.1 putative membrane protein YczE [Evansella vedderi]
MIKSDLGVGPWDAFFVGLASRVGLTTGSWVFIIGFLLVLINSLIVWKRPELIGMLTMFILGLLIDFWQLVVFSEFVLSLMYVRVFFLLGGIVIIGLGVALYLQANFARNPIDGLMLAVQKRTGKSMTISKTIVEVTALILAILVGGPIGVGTIIVAIFIGPIIQMFYNPLSAKLQLTKAI